jgi:hypothetical protein
MRPLPIGYSPIPSLDEIGRARVFYFWSILYYYYSVNDLILNLIERLWWTWFLVFSVGDHIRVWSLLHFIMLFYLAGLFEILICPKGFFSLAPGWYKEALICYYFYFIISRVVNSFWRYDNWGHILFRFNYIVR